jgi:hypothetical protein
MDSKYFSHPEQFNKDIEKHKFDDALFRSRVRNLILEEPARMDIRFSQAVDELRKIKEEFRL